MIKSINLMNFQSHKNTKLKFHKGVNVIVGPSDSGKTAILRALNWVRTNRPSGEAYRSLWGGDTTVQLEIGKGKFISRERWKNENRYTMVLGGNHLAIGEFKAMGQSVPEEVSKRLNMDNINIQNQLDAPFLLSNSPPEVCRILNRIASIDSIDLSIKNINSHYRKTKQELERIESWEIELKKQLKIFDPVASMDRILLKAEKREKKINKLKDKESILRNIIYTLKNLKDVDKKITKLVEFELKFNRILKLKDKLSEKEYFYHKCKYLCDEIIETDRAINNLEKETAKLTKEFHRLMPNACPLCGQRIIKTQKKKER